MEAREIIEEHVLYASRAVAGEVSKYQNMSIYNIMCLHQPEVLG